MTDDLVKRLREHAADIFNFRGNVMTAWDMARSMIAKGDKSSGPRDIIESYLDGYAEDMKESADRIEKLEAGEIEFDRIIGDYASENERFRDRVQKMEAALVHIYTWYPTSLFNPHQTIKDIKEFARKSLEEINTSQERVKKEGES